VINSFGLVENHSKRRFFDSFNREDSATIGSAETGQTSTVVHGAWAISGNKLINTSLSGMGTIIWETGKSDIILTADITHASYEALLFRYGGPTSYMVARVSIKTGYMDTFLYKYNGSYNTLGNCAVPGLNPGATINVKVTTIGESLTLYINGTQYLTATDNYNIDKTVIAIRTSNTSAGNAFDNLEVI
jgi:hypothetical protein